MSVPAFQDLTLPLLKVLADGRSYTNREAFDAVAQLLGLSDEDRREVLPSGRQARFENRKAQVRRSLRPGDERWWLTSR